MNLIFNTTLDGLAKGITIGVTILFIVIICSEAVLLHPDNLASVIALAVSFSVVYVACFLFRPIRYIVTEDHLIIQRPIKNLIIKRIDIKTIKELSEKEMQLTVRRFGVGGLFGYFGIFSNATIGKMSMYATRRNKAILIGTSHNKKLLLTPDNPLGFVDALKC